MVSAALVGCLWASAFVAFAAEPQAVTAIEIDRVLPSVWDVKDVSPVFLSDELIAVLVSRGPDRTGASQIMVLRWTGGKLQLVANAVKPHESDEIFAVSGNRILIAGSLHKYLYSADLKERWELAVRNVSDLFPRSATIGGQDQGGWKTFRLDPTATVVAQGMGDLLSVADDIVIYRFDNSIRAQSADGRLFAALPTPPEVKDFHTAEPAGQGRLYLNYYGKERIVDYQGKELRRLRPPWGWGFRHGWSADGGRMLFDHYTRSVPFSDMISDFFSRLLGGPEQDNGEIVSVLNTRTGGTCFVLDRPYKLSGTSGTYHADLSPSGRWVAFASLTRLSIYRLPETCAR